MREWFDGVSGKDLRRKDLDIAYLLQLLHVDEDGDEALLAFEGVAPDSAQVVDDGLRLQDNEKFPEVLHQWVREEGASFLHVIFLENIIAGMSDLREARKLGQVLLGVLILLDDGREQDHDDSSEGALVHEAGR